MTGATRNRGFTITELMIAVVLMGIVTSQVLLAFTNQHDSYAEQERVVEVQQETRLLMDLILADLRMAGFMVPKKNAIASVDGGPAGSDVICMSDPSIVDEARLDSATSRYEGASLIGALAGGSSTVSLVPSTVDIDDDGTVDFADGRGILISDGTNVHCALVTNVAGGSVTFDNATPMGITFPTSGTRAVPALVYQLAGTQLTRNGTVVATQVEDVQVQFGVDADRSGEVDLLDPVEFPIDDLAGSDLSLIRLARVSITSRTLQPDPDFQGQFTAVANRIPDVPDNFRRRRVTTDSLLRNLR